MMNGMPITMLSGTFGCPECGGTCGGKLHGALDYDIIKIGGKEYSANQIVDKQITANATTKLYKGTPGSGVIGEVKAGQVIGKVYSYVKASQSQDGRSWLMFDTGKDFFFVPNENASGNILKDQGALTLKDEIEKEKEEELLRTNPIEYYIKKYALKVLLIGGGIFIASQVANAAVRGFIDKKVSAK